MAAPLPPGEDPPEGLRRSSRPRKITRRMRESEESTRRPERRNPDVRVLLNQVFRTGPGARRSRICMDSAAGGRGLCVNTDIFSLILGRRRANRDRPRLDGM